MPVATNISKTLLEITGEPRLEIAILDILRDAIEHRIERIERELKKFEEKYHTAFNEFKEKFDREEISEPYSYDIEMDYLEWEGVVSRLSRYKALLSNLP